MVGRDKEIAKQIILEILRAGGVLNFKTSLFKAFYHAHLRFAATHTSYLSAWPIVRMPRGPGIDRFDVLIGELLAEGAVETHQIKAGPYEGFQFRITDKTARRNMLPDGAIEAIEYALEQVKGRTATQASDDSHSASRAWRDARDGEELNIYLDLQSDDEYAAQKQRVEETAEALRAAWR